MTNSIKKLQKLALLLFLAIFTAGLTSCDKDDDKDAPQTNSPIVGTWYFEDGGETISIYFGSNGRGTFEAQGPFTYSIDGNSLCLVFSDETGDYPDYYTILTLTKDTLIIRDEYGDTYNCHR